MLPPRCETCGQPATVHETSIGGGKAVTRHLCREHGEAVLPALDPASRAEALKRAEELYHGLPEAEKEHFALLHRLVHRGA